MDLTNWILFVLTETATAFMPGPAVIYVFSQGFAHGMRPALAANAGIITGNFIYFTLSAIGLAALILASHDLFLAIKWAGIIYLIWLGAGMLFGAASPLTAQIVSRAPHGRIFRRAIILQLANPKSLLFFLVILPPFINPGGNVALQCLILGLTSTVLEFTILAIYGALGNGMRKRLRASRAVVWIERSAGAALMALGASLAFVRRTD